MRNLLLTQPLQEDRKSQRLASIPYASTEKRTGGNIQNDQSHVEYAARLAERSRLNSAFTHTLLCSRFDPFCIDGEAQPIKSKGSKA